MKAKKENWCKLNCSNQTKGGTIVIGELKDKPILCNALCPGSDVRERIGRKEDAEIAMAK
jgi:hypothetical protein